MVVVLQRPKVTTTIVSLQWLLAYSRGSVEAPAGPATPATPATISIRQQTRSAKLLLLLNKKKEKMNKNKTAMAILRPTAFGTNPTEVASASGASVETLNSSVSSNRTRLAKTPSRRPTVSPRISKRAKATCGFEYLFNESFHMHICTTTKLRL